MNGFIESIGNLNINEIHGLDSIKSKENDFLIGLSKPSSQKN